MPPITRPATKATSPRSKISFVAVSAEALATAEASCSDSDYTPSPKRVRKAKQPIPTATATGVEVRRAQQSSPVSSSSSFFRRCINPIRGVECPAEEKNSQRSSSPEKYSFDRVPKRKMPRDIPPPRSHGLGLLPPKHVPNLAHALPPGVRNPLNIIVDVYRDAYSHHLFTDLLPYLLPPNVKVTAEDLCLTRKGVTQNAHLDLNLFLDILPDRGRDQVWLYTWKEEPHLGSLRYSIGSDPRFYALPVSGTAVRKVRNALDGTAVAASTIGGSLGGYRQDQEDPSLRNQAHVKHNELPMNHQHRRATGVPEPVVMGGRHARSRAVLEEEWDEEALLGLLVKLMGFKAPEPEYLPAILCCIPISREEAYSSKEHDDYPESTESAVYSAALNDGMRVFRDVNPRLSYGQKHPEKSRTFIKPTSSYEAALAFPTQAVTTERMHTVQDPDSGELVDKVIYEKWVPLPVCITPDPKVSWEYRQEMFWQPPMYPDVLTATGESFDINAPSRPPTGHSTSSNGHYTLSNLTSIVDTLRRHDLRCFQVVDATSFSAALGDNAYRLTPRNQIIIATTQLYRSRRYSRRWEWIEQELDELQAAVYQGSEEIGTGELDLEEEFNVGVRVPPAGLLTGNDIIWTIRGVEEAAGVAKGVLEDLVMDVVNVIRRTRGNTILDLYPTFRHSTNDGAVGMLDGHSHATYSTAAPGPNMPMDKPLSGETDPLSDTTDAKDDSAVRDVDEDALLDVEDVADLGFLEFDDFEFDLDMPFPDHLFPN